MFSHMLNLNIFFQHAKQRCHDKEVIEDEASRLKDSVTDLTKDNHELRKKL